jgi:hypothetical protein
VTGEATRVLGQAGATRVGGARGRRVELAVGTNGGCDGGSLWGQGARVGRRGGFCSRAQVKAVHDGPVRAAARHGLEQHVQGPATTCSGRPANGGAQAAQRGQRARTTWLGVGPTDIVHRDHGAWRTDLWTRAGLGVRVRRRKAAGHRNRARRRARGSSARFGAKTVRFSPAQMRFSPKSSTKVYQGLITKVVDHVTSYNFYKGQVVFFSTDCVQNACQDADFLGADE